MTVPSPALDPLATPSPPGTGLPDLSSDDGVDGGETMLALSAATLARAQFLCRGMAVVISLMAMVVLVGWLAGNFILTSLVSGRVRMNPLTAICFLLLGLALWMVAPSSSPRRQKNNLRIIAGACAGIVAIIGLLRLIAYLAHLSIPVDRLLFVSELDENQMAPNTAMNFLLLAWAVALVAWDRPTRYRLSPLLCLVAGAISLLAITGYVYRVGEFYRVLSYIPMALNTAVAFLLLSIGILVARPDREPLRTFLSDTIGGATARRLIPAAFIIPLVVGWLRLRGELAEFYTTAFGVSLFTLVTTAVFVALIWWNARFLHRIDLRRRRSDQKLRQAEAVYVSLVETLPQNIFRKNLRGQFTFGNRNFCTALGRTLSEIVGKTDRDFYAPDLAQRYQSDDRAVMDSGIPFHKIEEHTAGDGSLMYVEVIKTPVRDSDDQIIGVQGIYWDVTERKKAEEELHQSRERYDLAVRGSRDGLWDWNVRTNDIYFSPRWKEMIGYTDAEFPNRFDEWEKHLFPEDRQHVISAIEAYFEQRSPNYEVEFRLRHKDGDYRWILARGVALRDSSGKPYRMAGSHTDITSRKKAQSQLQVQNEKLAQAARAERQANEALKSAQAQLIQTEKLAGLGQMVAGVAHEINNPLSFVSNNVAVLQRDMRALVELLSLYQQADADVRDRQPELAGHIHDLAENIDLPYTLQNVQELLTRSREGLKRIQQIVKDLRDFARLDESDLSEIDLNAGIESTINIIHGHAKKKEITVKTELARLPLIACFPAKINQVIMNLLSNAIDASPSGQTVTVRTSSGEGPWADGSRGPVVRIEVIDHGSGMPTGTRERIFDPFFTTKPPGQGTGLGLSISYGIVRDHGGQITVESEPGKGSTFTVTLPARTGHDDGKFRSIQ